MVFFLTTETFIAFSAKILLLFWSFNSALMLVKPKNFPLMLNMVFIQDWVSSSFWRSLTLRNTSLSFSCSCKETKFIIYIFKTKLYYIPVKLLLKNVSELEAFKIWKFQSRKNIIWYMIEIWRNEKLDNWHYMEIPTYLGIWWLKE